MVNHRLRLACCLPYSMREERVPWRVPDEAHNRHSSKQLLRKTVLWTRDMQITDRLQQTWNPCLSSSKGGRGVCHKCEETQTQTIRLFLSLEPYFVYREEKEKWEWREERWEAWVLFGLIPRRVLILKWLVILLVVLLKYGPYLLITSWLHQP